MRTRWIVAALLIPLGAPVAAQDGEAPKPTEADVVLTPAERSSPRNEPGTWILSSDYPDAAIREGAEGSTAFSLIVDREGKPVDCVVSVSSGHPILDDLTCKLILERAEFEPARDETGRAVVSEYSDVVRWQIPDVEQIPDPFSYRFTYVVEKDGSVSECDTLEYEGPAELGSQCSLVPRHIPRLDADGEPLRSRVTVAVSYQVEELPASDSAVD